MRSHPLIRALTSILTLVGVLYCLPAFAQDARRLLEEGRVLDNQGRYADALQKFEQARVKAPEVTRILLLLAGQHLKLGHPEQALAMYEAFQQQETKPDPEEQETLGNGYVSCASLLEQAADRSPQRPELLLLAGRAAFRTHQLERAGALYQRYMQAMPQPAEPQREVRDQYLREFHIEVVRQLPSRIQQQPNQIALWLMLAESHLAVSQEEAALDALDHYRERSPNRSSDESVKLAKGYQELLVRWGSASGSQSLLRGRAHFGLGQLAPAGEDYERYRKTNPDQTPAYVERQGRYERELQEAVTKEKAIAARREAEVQARLAKEQALAEQRAAQERRRSDEQRARASRWMLWTGAAGIGVGAGLLALGITGIAYDGRCINDIRPCDQVYDSFNLGIGMTVAGGALLLGGSTLLGIGAYRSRGSRAPIRP